MSGTTITIAPIDTKPAPSSSPNAVQHGTLSVTSNPSPLAIVVLDHQMKRVAQGVSPLRIALQPGLYMVRATLAGYPDLTQLAWVIAKADRSVHLSESEPTAVRVAISMVSTFLDKYIRKLNPLPPQSHLAPANEAELKPVQFYIRFCRLKDWNSAEQMELPEVSSGYVRGRAVLEVTNPLRHLVFVQIVRQQGPVLNVAIPPAGAFRPAQCQLVISSSAQLLTAHVRLSTEWANAAVQYVAQGYVAEAKELIEARKDRHSSVLERVLQALVNRFDDPVAELVPRYVALRSRDGTVLTTLPDSLLDLLQEYLSDGAIISAETAARERQFKLATQRILSIRPGGIPLFTEGFSLLIHRVRELLDLATEHLSQEAHPSEDEMAQLKELKRTLNRWAPYLELNCPTVTFWGDDITNPQTTQTSIDPRTTEGWIPGPEPQELQP